MLKFGITLLFTTLIHLTAVAAWCGHEPSAGGDEFRVALSIEFIV